MGGMTLHGVLVGCADEHAVPACLPPPSGEASIE